MPLILPNSFLEAILKGQLDLETAAFKVMLSTSAYSPNRKTHSMRSHVGNQVSGDGYTAGGAAVDVAVTRDDTLDRLIVALPGATWDAATIAGARVATYYRARGGDASLDEIIAWNVFPNDVSAANVPLVLTASSIIVPNPPL